MADDNLSIKVTHLKKNFKFYNLIYWFNFISFLKLEFEIKDLNEERKNILNSKLLTEPGISKLEINDKENRLYINTHLSTSIIHDKIETLTDSLAVLRGIGSVNNSSDIDAAVAEINNDPNIKTIKPIIGVIRFVQLDTNNCLLDGTIDGLSPGQHAINICEYGDLSNGCKSIGNHFNPDNKNHGRPTDEDRVINYYIIIKKKIKKFLYKLFFILNFNWKKKKKKNFII